MPHVVVAGKIHPSGLELLRKRAGVTLDYIEAVSEDSFVPFIARADALVIRTQPLRAATLARAPHLKIVARHGVGYDSIDVDALDARRIPLAIVGDVNAASVAEHAMALLLACIKNIPQADRAVRIGQWDWRDDTRGGDLCGRRLLIVGYGRIGQAIAQLARGFSMSIAAFDPFLDGAVFERDGVARASDLKGALSQADVVTVHVPRSDGPLLDADMLATLRPGSIVINTARGGVVDERALAEALEQGRIGAAGLDVFETEPPEYANRLLRLDNVVLTPHVGALTDECAERMAVACAQNILSFFDDRLDRNLIVNLKHAQAPS